MSGANALKYGAAGAAAGTVAGPIGTVVGGVVGAGIGALTGNGGGGVQTSGGYVQGPAPPPQTFYGSVGPAQSTQMPLTPTYNSDGTVQATQMQPQVAQATNAAPDTATDTGPRSNFTYGANSETNKYANAYANNDDLAAAAYANQGQQTAQQANDAFGVAYGAQNRQGPQIASNQADLQRQLAAYGNLNQTAGQLQGNAGALQGNAAQLQGNAALLQQMGTAPMGASVAAAQLQQGQDAAAAQNLAMAHSGRSIGGGAANMQAAQFQNATQQQQMNGQAAAARLQEQQNYNQFQLGALGASTGAGAAAGQSLQGAGQNYGAATNAYGAAGGQANTVAQQNLGVQQTNAGLTQQQQQINNQTSQTFGQIGQGLNSTGIQQQGLGQNEQQLANQIRTTQLGATEQYQNSIEGNSIAQQGLNNQQTGMYLGAATGLAGAAAQYEGSDREAKKDIVPAGGERHPWTNWNDFGHAIFGGGDAAPATAAAANPGAMVRDPHNPSRMVSPYANIGAASNGARPPDISGQRPDPSQLFARQQLAAFAPGGAPAPAPSTWGGQVAPIQPGYDVNALDAAYAREGAPPPSYAVSDVHSKARIQELEGQLAALGGAPSRTMLNQAASDQDVAGRIQYSNAPARGPSPAMLQQAAADQDQGGVVPAPDRPSIDLRPAAPYSYEYKDPQRHGQGRFYGPMAQDLEKTPAGASVVKHAPDGTKMVDTSRLSLLNTGAISDLQRQIAALGGSNQYPARGGAY